MLSWGLPLGKEAEFWLRVDKRKNTPRPRPRLLLWSAGQEGLICAPPGLGLPWCGWRGVWSWRWWWWGNQRVR